MALHDSIRDAASRYLRCFFLLSRFGLNVVLFRCRFRFRFRFRLWLWLWLARCSSARGSGRLMTWPNGACNFTRHHRHSRFASPNFHLVLPPKKSRAGPDIRGVWHLEKSRAGRLAGWCLIHQLQLHSRHCSVGRALSLGCLGLPWSGTTAAALLSRASSRLHVSGVSLSLSLPGRRKGATVFADETARLCCY